MVWQQVNRPLQQPLAIPVRFDLAIPPDGKIGRCSLRVHKPATRDIREEEARDTPRHRIVVDDAVLQNEDDTGQ